MKINKSTILTMNAGSSSIKFALYEQQELRQLFYGEIENLEQKTHNSILQIL